MNKFVEIHMKDEPFNMYFSQDNGEYQMKAKKLCWEYNQTGPHEMERRQTILKELFGSYPEFVMIQPTFQCDYGFNIHFHGFAMINYNCVILDTSPVHIGHMVFIAPGVCISCAGHAIHPLQRLDGLSTSAPITIHDNVWIGANATICPGVTIGEGSIIGAGSVVNRDIPAGVVAAGVPCRVLRTITEEDKIKPEDIIRTDK